MLETETSAETRKSRSKKAKAKTRSKRDSNHSHNHNQHSQEAQAQAQIQSSEVSNSNHSNYSNGKSKSRSNLNQQNQKNYSQHAYPEILKTSASFINHLNGQFTLEALSNYSEYDNLLCEIKLTTNYGRRTCHLNIPIAYCRMMLQQSLPGIETRYLFNRLLDMSITGATPLDAYIDSWGCHTITDPEIKAQAAEYHKVCEKVARVFKDLRLPNDYGLVDYAISQLGQYVKVK